MTTTRPMLDVTRTSLVWGAAAVAVCLAVGTWTIVTPKTPATRPPRAVDPRWTGKHFTGKVQYDLLAKLLADDRRNSSRDGWMREIADPHVRVGTQAHPLLGNPAPDFTLVDSRGEDWNLQRQRRRGPVLLVFYLGYSCSACVHGLFELNADVERFHRLGAEVVAVSGDSPAVTRQRFAEYGAFSFPVLCDPHHEVSRCYGTYRPENGVERELLLHGTLIVGRDGRVYWANIGDTPFRNDRALLHEVARLENRPQSEPIQANDNEAKR